MLRGCRAVIIDSPGYGGRKLWSDESMVPVRAEIAWLIPQADAHYSLFQKDVSVVARRMASSCNRFPVATTMA